MHRSFAAVGSKPSTEQCKLSFPGRAKNRAVRFLARWYESDQEVATLARCMGFGPFVIGSYAADAGGSRDA